MEEQEKLSPPEIKMATGVGPPPETIPGLPPAPTPPEPEFFSPETIGPSPIPEGVTKRGKLLKTTLVILGIVVLVGGVGAFGYFVIFPLVSTPKVPTTVQRPQVVTPVAPHKSYLVTSPAAEAGIKLSDRSFSSIVTALQNESFNQLADGQFKEVKISDSNGQVAFLKYLAIISPSTTALVAGDWFENDFTALFYYDAKGVWPIYVVKMKAGVDPEAVRKDLQTLEKIIELSNFYLTTPGTFTAFKDGKAGNYKTRYAVGSQPGAAFNYGIFGNYLILSTNYNGLKAVLPVVGL